jgi:hypothetical protein
MKARSFSSPGAFKESLEQRLRDASPESGGADVSRRRQLLVFDRFLARLDRVLGDAVIVKGGLVLELRLERARTTKDIDLRLTGPKSGALESLQQAGRLELADFMTFEVQFDRNDSKLRGEDQAYEGVRYRVEAKLAGRPYSRRFGVDVVFSEPMVGEPDIVTAKDTLGFAGIAPPRFRVYPMESHIAEKLHAYTLPRKRENSRVKDLPDLALLSKVKPIQSKRLRHALERTFLVRKTHKLPTFLPDPPASWAGVYARMAENDRLEWSNIAEVLAAARRFIEPVLEGSLDATWSPEMLKWE